MNTSTSSLQENCQDSITVVSGLPRSGTSMMMQMLEAGGMVTLTDNERKADISNPKGYYEFERVKKLLDSDFGWLDDARGKVVKIVSALLVKLPPTHSYNVIFMRRHMDEILRSQTAMLIKDNKPTDRVSDEQLAQLYERHLVSTFKWIKEHPNVSVLDISYNDLFIDALSSISKITSFLGNSLDEQQMASVINPDLYRQQS